MNTEMDLNKEVRTLRGHVNQLRSDMSKVRIDVGETRTGIFARQTTEKTFATKDDIKRARNVIIYWQIALTIILAIFILALLELSLR